MLRNLLKNGLSKHLPPAWEYGYDTRKRLTHALRINDAGVPEFRMAYAYDAADNMTSQTKYNLTPAVSDTFSDGNYTAAPVWTVGAGVWTAASNYLMNTATNSALYTANTNANADIRYSYSLDNLGFIFNGMDVYLRYIDANNYLRLRWFLGMLALNQMVNGVSTDLATASVLDQSGPWYDVEVQMNGDKITLYHGSQGQGVIPIMKEVSTGILSTSRLQLQTIGTNSRWCFDNIRILTRSIDTAQTGSFTYNEANQMTAGTLGGVNTTFTYDAWGRMNSKTAAGATLTYKWRFGDKLQGVYSNGTPLVQYNYDGLGKRRIKATSTTNWTWWRWGMGYEPLAEYHDTNNNWTVEGFAQFNVMKNMMQPLAEAAVPAGQTPANGTYSYLALDFIKSTRIVFNQFKVLTTIVEYDPYGQILNSSGVLPYHLYTAKPFDAQLGMYYFPFRYYSPTVSRWISLDPIGIVDGPNQYLYLHANPADKFDTYGLCWIIKYGPNGEILYQGPCDPSETPDRCREDFLASLAMCQNAVCRDEAYCSLIKCVHDRFGTSGCEWDDVPCQRCTYTPRPMPLKAAYADLGVFFGMVLFLGVVGKRRKKK